MAERPGSATPAKLKVDDSAVQTPPTTTKKVTFADALYMSNNVQQQQQADGGSAELTAVVDELLHQLTDRFSSVSSELLQKIDDMSRRLDNLEANVQASKHDEEPSK